MNKKSGKPTLLDVAKAANLSISTVSRTLSDNGYPVSEESRMSVLSAVEKVGYDLEHYKVSSRNKYKIALVIPNVLNPYYPRLISGVSNACSKLKIDFVLFSSENNQQKEKQILNDIRVYDYSGVILVSICNDYSHISRLLSLGVNLIICEQPINMKCSRIVFDYYSAGYLAAKFLVKRGNKKIAYISSPLTRPSRIDLFKGFTQGLSHCGLEMDKSLILISDEELHLGEGIYEFENGRKQIRKLINHAVLPDGIFCINDLTAIGSMKELELYNFRIPDDIAIMGFDNILSSNLTNPPLTTIDQSAYQLGSMAVEMIINKLEDPNREEASMVLEPKIIVRESV